MTVRRCTVLPVLIWRARAVPDPATLMKFRYLLEKHELTRKLFDGIGIMLCERGRPPLDERARSGSNGSSVAHNSSLIRLLSPRIKRMSCHSE
jgi:IS5 family transposase